MKPLVIELFAGLHGWGEGFLAESYRVVGFDILDMCAAVGVARPKGIELVLQDVRTLHGSQFRDAACIVASPPCQKYSYMAMPWKRAKTLAAWYRESAERIAELNELFDACFRIQREASEAAGRYIPMVLENVKGAQPWVGKAKARYGSMYLWGDGTSSLPISRHKKQEMDGSWFYDNYEKSARRFSSQSPQRKQWSAEIAKIPPELARHIARCFKPPVGDRRNMS